MPRTMDRGYRVVAGAATIIDPLLRAPTASLGPLIQSRPAPNKNEYEEILFLSGS